VDQRIEKNETGQLWMLMRIAAIEREENRLESSRNLAEQVLTRAIELEDLELQVKCYEWLGLLANDEGQSARTRMHWQKALAICEKLKKTQEAAEFKIALARLR